jgi:hypothetical protein
LWQFVFFCHVTLNARRPRCCWFCAQLRFTAAAAYDVAVAGGRSAVLSAVTNDAAVDGNAAAAVVDDNVADHASPYHTYFESQFLQVLERFAAVLRSCVADSLCVQVQVQNNSGGCRMLMIG